MKLSTSLLSGFVIAAWLVSFLAGQNACQITGHLVNESKQPVAGAGIKVEALIDRLTQEVTTAGDGSYLVVGLVPGSYRLEVTATDMVSESRILTLTEAGSATEANFELRRKDRVQASTGADEKNPNIFISKIDLDATRDLLRRRVIEPLALEFDGTQSFYGAEFGSPLRQVIIAKPAARAEKLRGRVFWSHQNSALNARPFFNVGRLQPAHRNQVGFSGSSPLLTPSISLTGSGDFVKEAGFVNGNVRVPLPNERTPRSGDPLTDRLISGLLQGYPDQAPNMPGVLERQLNTNAWQDFRSANVSLRSDVRISDRDSFVARYVMSDSSENPFELVAGQNPKTELRPQSLSLTEVHSLGTTTSVSSSLYFDRLRARLLPTEHFRSLLAPIGLADVPDIDFGGDFSDLSALGPGSEFPRKRYQNRFGGYAGAVKSTTSHQLRWGGSVLRVQTNDLQSDNTRGKFLFSNNFGRTAIENFLHGTPTKFTLAIGDPYRGFRHSEYSLYLTDSYRLTPDLTLTLGTRWEATTAPTEVNRRTEIPYKTDANNWAPQVGFAWRPTGQTGFTIRGGYGISYGQVFPATYQAVRFNPPQVQIVSIQGPSLANPLKDLDLTANRKKSELELLSPDLVSPYAHQYNLLIQKALGRASFEIGYVGNRTIKLFFPFVSNRAAPVNGIPSTTATIDQRRPNPELLSVKTVLNSGILYFDALKLGFQTATEHAALDVTYIFSKSLTSGCEFYNTLNAESSVALSQNNEDFQADLKSPSELDARHSLVLNYRYDLPSPHHQVLESFLAGWSLTASARYRTGNWFNIGTSSDAPGFGNVDGESDDRPNILNPSVLGRAVDNPDTSSSIFNPAFFDSNIPAGGRGNIGLRVFRKDSLNIANLSLQKRLRLSEANRVGFTVEFYNLFNHPQFQRPGDVFPSPTFGTIVDTQNKGRVIQVRIEWDR